MSEVETGTRPSHRFLWVTLGLLASVAIFAGGWAAQAVFTPPENVVDENDLATVQVREGSIASYLDIAVAASWTESGTAVNRRSGTVTSLDFVPGEEVQQGQTVYTVDLTPISVAEGRVPMYRPIGPGSKGEDVAQLQRLLSRLGFFSGSDDGMFGPGTESAIKKWQKAAGEPSTGVVDLGRVIFVDSLPTRLAVLDEFQVGDVVAGGEAAFAILAPTAQFVGTVTESQARKIEAGQVVEITSPTGTIWSGKADLISTDAETGSYRLSILPLTGEAICGGECANVPADDVGASLRGRVVLQEELSGVIVPTAALISRGDGTAAVIRADGDQIQVTVVASADGQSLVEGVEPGTDVQAPVGEG
ncbi:peptidoglycan-binding protein [Microbacterium sp. M]|uniref:peptidoglycan-binding protein n=1 Tax=Microbacterium sp. M TaxID=3377125 RepID=UPI003869C778